MELAHGLHLAYCTNIHAAETWEQTQTMLEQHVLRVRRRVCAEDRPFAIGLRLGARAAEELRGQALTDFRHWLDRHHCYVFTINGFPYGAFHGTRVKEQVYRPDWSQPERLAYTQRLFEILAELLPDGVAGSVSTLPGSFKHFIEGQDHLQAINANLRRCADVIERLAEQSGHDLHLGLEPEPFGLFETTAGTVRYFELLLGDAQGLKRERLLRRLGINYDTCHLAVQFEDAALSLDRLTQAGIRLSKLHLSSALKLADPARHATTLAPFVEPTYLHQVVQARDGQIQHRYVDLDDALAVARQPDSQLGDEWRVHFHVPLHARPAAPLQDTHDHLLSALAWLARQPGRCTHLEMETYTWNVLPAELRADDVVDQLAREYEWTLARLGELGLAGSS